MGGCYITQGAQLSAEGSGEGGNVVHIQLVHFVVEQKLTERSKAIIQ